jgi:hypothetical protein
MQYHSDASLDVPGSAAASRAQRSTVRTSRASSRAVSRAAVYEPGPLVARLRHTAQEPRLCPADRAGAKRRVDLGQAGQRAIYGREVAQLARRDPRPRSAA